MSTRENRSRVTRLDLIWRVDLVLSEKKKKKRSTPSCAKENAGARALQGSIRHCVLNFLILLQFVLYFLVLQYAKTVKK